MNLKSILKRIFASKLRIMDTIVVILLLMASIYGVYSVTYSYLFENITTTTVVQTANNIGPFAKYLTISYVFRNSSVFPETWCMNKSELKALFPGADFRSGNFHSGHRIRSGRVVNDSSSLADMVDIASTMGTISVVDNVFMNKIFVPDYNATGSHSLESASETSFTNVSLKSNSFDVKDFSEDPRSIVLDLFMQNPKADKLIDDVVSHIVGKNFARYISWSLRNNITDVPTKFLVNRLRVDGLDISIPLDFIGDLPMNGILLGVLPFDQRCGTPEFHSVESTFAPFYASVESDQQLHSPKAIFTKPFLSSSLKFRNIAVYDSSAVRSETDCHTCQGLPSVELCKKKCQVDSVIEMCGCVPFTYSRLYATDPTLGKLRRCTTGDYRKCLGKKFDPGRCLDERIMPCVLQRNAVQNPLAVSYDNVQQLSASEFLRNYDKSYLLINEIPPYRMYFNIESRKKMYIVFRAQFQNTWVQTLGQVGGNLGIYLPFSLYGLWAVAVSCYQACKRYLTESSANRKQSILVPWLRLAQLHINADRGTDGQDDTAKKLNNILSVMESFSTKCRETENLLVEQPSADKYIQF